MTPAARDGWCGLLAAIATGACAFAALRHGVALGPDAWSYWGASVALLDGRGYVDAHGLAVLEWPPGYALWLAAVQALFGVALRSVQVADVLMLALTAGLGTTWALRCTARAGGRRWPVMVFFTAAMVLAGRGVASEYAMLALVFALLLALRALLAATTGGQRLLWWALAVALAFAATMMRHAAVAFVPASMWLLWRGGAHVGSGRGRWRSPAALGFGAAVLGGWWLVRWVLGQGGSHAMWGSQRTFLATVWQMAEGAGRVVWPFPVGIVIWLAFAVALRRSMRAALQPWLTFALLALAAVLTMFLLVAVHDAPGERFVRFASLMVAGLGLGVARHCSGTAWRGHAPTLVLVLLLAPNVVHAGKYVLLGRRGSTTVTPTGGESFLPPHATLARAADPHAAGTVLADGRQVVAAPVFVWQADRLARGEAR